MEDKKIIERLEEQIDNAEGMRFMFNQRLDDMIERLKILRRDIYFEENK